MRKKQVTQLDIAKRLGISTHTVSKALSGQPGMSEQTRRAIFRAARELGYRTKQQETALAIDKLTVQPEHAYRFLFVSFMHSDLLKLLYEGLSDRLSELGHKLEWVIYSQEAYNEKQLEDWLDKHSIAYAAGLFLSFGFPLPIEKRLLQVPIPKLLLNYPETGIEADSIIWDVYDATSKSVHSFVEAGHRQILYVGDIYSQRGFRRRWQAFSETMIDTTGLDVKLDEHMVRFYRSQQEWMAAYKQIWAKRQPTAILCAIDFLLPWVYAACDELELQIPKDVSLISLETVHSNKTIEVTHPHLLVRETGERAADRLLWRIANPHLPYEHIRLQCRWHDGGTIRPLKNGL